MEDDIWRGGERTEEVQVVPVWLRLPCAQHRQTRHAMGYGRYLRFDMHNFSVSDQAYMNNLLREAGLPTWNFALQTHNGALKAVINRLAWDSRASTPQENADIWARKMNHAQGQIVGLMLLKIPAISSCDVMSLRTRQHRWLANLFRDEGRCMLFDVLDVVCVGQFAAPASEDASMDPVFSPIVLGNKAEKHGTRRSILHVAQSCAERILQYRVFSVHHGQCRDLGPLCAVFESWRQDNRGVVVMIFKS